MVDHLLTRWGEGQEVQLEAPPGSPAGEGTDVTKRPTVRRPGRHPNDQHPDG
jgi:hypothetical protein